MTRATPVAVAALVWLILGLQAPEAAAVSNAKPTAETVSTAEARAGCVAARPEGDETCSVTRFDPIGAVDSHRFHYAVYQYRSAQNNALDHMRIVVFEAVSPDMLRAVAMTETDPAISYEKPKLLRSGGRVLLRIPGYESGTGNFNRERLFVWRDGQWRNVDTATWLDDLARRLPRGHGAWKGIYPDYVTMRTSTPIWREGDGNACPSGGRADIVLAWSGDRLALREVHLRKAGERGEALPKRRAVN